MDISIILLNYKSSGLLKQALKGIICSQPQLDYEIVVVDNNSGDGSLEMAKGLFSPEYVRKLEISLDRQISLPPIKTIQSPINGGFSYGHNLAIKESSAKYILVLNPDIAIETGVLEKMMAYLEAHPDVGVIGPKLINPDGTIQYSCRRFPNSLIPLYRRTFVGKLPFAKKSVHNYLMSDFDHEGTIEVDWLFGACLLINRRALDQVGLFDQRFFMYFEDLDLCRRFWEKNFKVVFFAEIRLVHYHQRFSAEREGIRGIFKRGGRIHLFSGLKYFLKYFGKPLPSSRLDKSSFLS
jgi:hypothetical protein